MSRLLVFVLACRAAGFAAAQDPHPDAARELDVAGVRIGMSQDEAVRAASDRLDVARDAVRFDASPSTDPAAGNDLPRSFSIRTARETLIVHFAARVPADPLSPQMVDRVTYEMPWSPRNEAGMKQAALQKYGDPANGTRGLSQEWCARTMPDPGNPGIGCLQAYGPVLKLSGTRLDLSDRRLQELVSEYLIRQRNQFARF
jgi:hypothetical protein